jgi:hypothetical protein
VYREYIKLPKFTKYENTQRESSWDSKQMLKTTKDRICQ